MDDQQVILSLAALVIFICGAWLAEDDLRKRMMSGTKRPEVYCPLHRQPASKCAKQHKDD